MVKFKKNRKSALKSVLPAAAAAIISLVLFACSNSSPDPVSYVNPYMGNISHLLVPTYPTVHLPNSLLRFYPNRENFTSNTMRGFPLNVISHRSGKIFNLAPVAGSPEDIQRNP